MSDDRLRELGERLIYIERPDVLTNEVRDQFDNWCRKRKFADDDAPWVTVGSALEEVQKLRMHNEIEDAELLGEIEMYLEKLSGAGPC